MFKKATIILIPFPFTNLSANKVRPALIISSNKIRGDDIVVIFISSKNFKKPQATDIVIKNSSKFFNRTGLKGESVIKINKIATLDKKLVIGELGEISEEIQKDVDNKIKMLFDL